MRPDAFGRAQTHSRRVRVLKLALPLAAVVIAVAFPVYSYLAAPAGIPVEADGSAYSDGKLVMANPKLTGFTSKDLPYSMTAMRAIQDVAKESLITLEGINAKLPVDAKTIAAITASQGVYDRDENTLRLSKQITVSTNDGMTAKFSSAFIDMGKGNMKTNDPVEITRSGSRITSDTMTVRDNGNILVFRKRVRVHIEPAAAKAADNNSGESNAAQ